MRQIVAILGVVVLLSAPALALAQYDYPPGGSGGPPMGGAPPATGGDGGMSVENPPSIGQPSIDLPAIGGDDGNVTIVDFAFQPQQVSVPAGSTVSWENAGAAPHTVTSSTGAFDSGTIGSGAGFSETFSDPGLYPYHCTIHPNMTGMVQVTAS